MYEHIITLERQLTKLLPYNRQAPTAELLAKAREWSAAVWRQAVTEGPLQITGEHKRDGLRLAQRPVFITGVHRSGTTMVRDLLDDHPQLCVLPSEGTFLTNLRKQLVRLPVDQRAEFLCTEWLRRIANPINQPPYWLLGSSTTHHSFYVEFACAFKAWYEVLSADMADNLFWPHLAVVLAYATVTENLKADYWVDKTPTQEKFLNRTIKHFPEARFIHVIRDPAAVLASRKLMEPQVKLKRCLEEMAHSYKLATKRTPITNLHVVRYEELCHNASNADAMRRFLNIAHHRSLLNTTVNGKPAGVNSSFNNDSPKGQIINAVADNAIQIPEAEMACLSAYVAKHAAKAGYVIPRISAVKKAIVAARLWFK